MKTLLSIIVLFVSINVNAQTADTVYVESFSKMDTVTIINNVIEKSDIIFPNGQTYIPITACKLETLNKTTVKVVFEFNHLPYGEIWLYNIGYIVEK